MATEKTVPGFTDTPILPGTGWHVHDPIHPQPPIVLPGEYCAGGVTLGAPSDAIMLFDGTDLSGWIRSDTGEPAQWLVQDGYMEVVPGAGSIETKEHFGDCQLHVEFACPAEVEPDEPYPGNSGVFMMGLYEVQVLDCWEHLIYADGVTGAMYGQVPPLVNACRRPGEWQTFDIVWEAHRFSDGKLIRPARITALFNGLLIHLRSELRGRTTYKQVTDYSEPLPNEGPVKLQNHGGDQVRFRNIWYRPLSFEDRS